MWSNAIEDLRALLSDGPTDRYNFRKRCFGELNGTNTRFKTFDFRRITDFTTSAASAGQVFLNGVPVPATGIAADFILTGEFQLVTPPVDGDILEASYFQQWFIDSELDSFLQTGSRWLFSSGDYVNITPDGLIPAVLKYAASEAYLKMSIRWRTYLSDGFKVEDVPKEAGKAPADPYIGMAKTFRDEALALRDEFYKRQGQALQPLFATISGRVRNLP